MIPYLLLADLQNTALAAFLSFYDRVLYPTYESAPRLWNISSLRDQAAAGAIMWVPGCLIFLAVSMTMFPSSPTCRQEGRMSWHGAICSPATPRPRPSYSHSLLLLMPASALGIRLHSVMSIGSTKPAGEIEDSEASIAGSISQ